VYSDYSEELSRAQLIQYNTIQKKFIERYSREIESEALDDSEPY